MRITNAPVAMIGQCSRDSIREVNRIQARRGLTAALLSVDGHSTMSGKCNRRSFMQGASTAFAASAPLHPAHVQVINSNERIRLGFIRFGSRRSAVLADFCEFHSQSHVPGVSLACGGLRKILDRPDIDAVTTVAVLDAGKAFPSKNRLACASQRGIRW